MSKQEPNVHLVIGYSHVLRQFCSQNDTEAVSRLLKHLNRYLDFVLNNSQSSSSSGYLILLITILQNKSQLPNFQEDFVVKFWNACKENLSDYSKFEEYFQLVVLIMGHVSNDDFPHIMADLLELSVSIYLFFLI